MNERISDAYAQAHLNELIDRVNQEDINFIIETEGRARAVLISYTKYQMLTTAETRAEE